jgi:hypothetical protein
MIQHDLSRLRGCCTLRLALGVLLVSLMFRTSLGKLSVEYCTQSFSCNESVLLPTFTQYVIQGI